MPFPITENVVATDRHSSFYLECGPADGVPIIFVHGWPELAISWRAQLPAFAELGFRCIAPDMRGYGRSSQYARTQDYTAEECVTDLMELLAGIGADKATWIGHDAGAGAVWQLAAHHPQACIAVANLCVPYLPQGFTLESMVPLVNRDIYPADQYPFGQWQYWQYHNEAPEQIAAVMNRDIEHSVRLFFRRGSADHEGRPSGTVHVKAPDGWEKLYEATRGIGVDEAVLDEESYRAFVASFKRRGLARVNAFYRNDSANAAYASTAVNGTTS